MFVDESGFHVSMTRLRSRAPKGERAYGKVPRNRGKNQTLIASITLQGSMGEAVSIEVRKAGARTREALNEAISEAMSAVTLEDVAGWFSHCGYEPRDQYS